VHSQECQEFSANAVAMRLTAHLAFLQDSQDRSNWLSRILVHYVLRGIAQGGIIGPLRIRELEKVGDWDRANNDISLRRSQPSAWLYRSHIRATCGSHLVDTCPECKLPFASRVQLFGTLPDVGGQEQKRLTWSKRKGWHSQEVREGKGSLAAREGRDAGASKQVANKEQIAVPLPAAAPPNKKQKQNMLGKACDADSFFLRSKHTSR
jgi:hypothetical protein